MMGLDFAFGVLVGALIFGTVALFIGAASQDDPCHRNPSC